MQCINHNDQPAVAICMSCGCALCGACVHRTVGNRIVCSDSCAATLSSLLNASHEGVSRAARSNRVTAWYLWLLGVTLLGFGAVILMSSRDLGFASYFLILGPVSIVIGFFYNRLGKRLPSSQQVS